MRWFIQVQESRRNGTHPFLGGQKGRDLATGKIAPVQLGNIQQRTKWGTVMPPDPTASLTRTELRDLVKYLSTLKTTGQPR